MVSDHMQTSTSMPVTKPSTLLDWDKLSSYFDFSSQKLIIVGAYAGIGFFLGFFLKKYGRSVVIGLAAFALLLFCLDYLNVISFNWDQARTLLGLAPSDTVESLVQSLIAWARAQMVLVVVALISFIVGYKVG